MAKPARTDPILLHLLTGPQLPAELLDRSPQTCLEAEQKRDALLAQFIELRRQGQGCSCPEAGIVWVTCPCGRRLALYHAYKCAVCGFYLCWACAKRHFGLDAVCRDEGADAEAAEAAEGGVL